jgi:hypothetical protein
MLVRSFEPMRALITTDNDAISDAARAVSVQSSLFCSSELRSPWGFAVDGSRVAKFHLVLDGECWLTVGDREPLRLVAGDLVLLPRGCAHSVGAGTEPPNLTLDQLLARAPLDETLTLRAGGNGDLTRLLCGGFLLGSEVPGNVLSSLPQVVLADAGALSWGETVTVPPCSTVVAAA